MIVTIGRTVRYRTTEAQRDALVALGCNLQTDLPAVVVAVFGNDCVNLKVSVDGNHPDLWVTSSLFGDNEGEWNWFN